MIQKIIVSIFFVFVVLPMVKAGTIPGRWEKVAALEEGAEIVVELKTGERLECIFQSVEGDTLMVVDDLASIPVPKPSIEQVVQYREDTPWDGMAIGAGIGFAAGTTVLLAMKASGGDWATSDAFELFGPIGAGAGAGIGLAVDASGQKKEQLYKAP